MITLANITLFFISILCVLLHHDYIVITSLLCLYFIIITSLLQMGNHVMMILLLRVVRTRSRADQPRARRLAHCIFISGAGPRSQT